MNTKQVIIVRKDLKMRRGKEMSMASHASLGAILSCGYYDTSISDGTSLSFSINFCGHRQRDALTHWLENSFTKICVYVDSEQELIDLDKQAYDAGLIRCLITDNGKTEFNGVPTKTALAIGPALVEDVDKITGHLRLA